MPLYKVTWEIDIDAETPKAAAIDALRIQRDSSSSATVFTVYSQKGTTTHTIDLNEITPI
ncbi:MAG: hypothetical protein EHM66_00460 [Deltaproteobacteria bacterium]|nr:MAG: hypothetical protein EHM66_00460 [Deltaproteobacteria bacterium]